MGKLKNEPFKAQRYPIDRFRQKCEIILLPNSMFFNKNKVQYNELYKYIYVCTAIALSPRMEFFFFTINRHNL